MTKAHILAEIKRTAECNGGVPLGWRRFTLETGIREADWLGIHWARWSDALRECGLAPNRLNEAYATEELLQKYAELALELGRLPVRGDLLLKAHATRGFPSHNTWSKFGGKAELIKLMRKHCMSAGPQEVVGMCDEYLGRQPEQLQDENDDVRAADEVGFVYLIKSGRFFKIGRSNSVGRRERELAIQLPEPARTIHAIRTDDPAGIEAYWHARFAEKRKNGEWFDLTAKDVSAFKRRKFM
ncbi:MAG: GIY-YIG nuclease family protein [Polyangia bacterium]